MFETSPISHLVSLGLIAWLYVMLRRVTGPSELRGARARLVGVLSAWALLSSWLAYAGYYEALNERYLLLTVCQPVPFLLVGALAGASASVRELLRSFVERVPLASFASVHAVRVLAVGTIYKWWVGLMPSHFIVPVAFPDFAIGLTALWMARRMARNPAGNARLFIAWNVAGAVILMLAIPLIQLSQPGPLQLFTEGPRTDEVIGFPMSIIPTFAAPLLVMLHAASLLALRARSLDERHRAGDA